MLLIMTTEDSQTADSQPTTTPVGQPELTKTADWFTTPDFELQAMAACANRTGTGIPIRLVLSGSIISGTICSGEDYFRWVSEQVTSNLDTADEATRQLSEMIAATFFDIPADNYRKQREAQAENVDATDDLQIAFIHLRDAAGVNGPHVRELGFTRVMLSQVAAWSIGRIS